MKITSKMKIRSKKRKPQKWRQLHNCRRLKKWRRPKNEHNLKNEDHLKNENDLKIKMTSKIVPPLPQKKNITWIFVWWSLTSTSMGQMILTECYQMSNLEMEFNVMNINIRAIGHVHCARIQKSRHFHASTTIEKLYIHMGARDQKPRVFSKDGTIPQHIHWQSSGQSLLCLILWIGSLKCPNMILIRHFWWNFVSTQEVSAVWAKQGIW